MIPPDYGNIQVFKISNKGDYNFIMETIRHDSTEDSGFIHNIDTFNQMYAKRNRLFGLCVQETESMEVRDAQTNDPIFGSFLLDGAPRAALETFQGIISKRKTKYILPCICLRTNRDLVHVMWVHSKFQRLGLGKTMVQLLNIKRACHVLPESRAFWTACDVQIV